MRERNGGRGGGRRRRRDRLGRAACEALEGRLLLAAASVVKDVDPRVNGFSIADVTATAGRTFFTVNGSGGYQLWSTDGTDAGTSSIKTWTLQPTNLTAVGGTLYFAAADITRPGSPRELWRSDGTAAGTVPLTSFAYQGSTVGSMTDAGASGIYFVANQGGYASELWKTDGTAAGTVRVSAGDVPNYLVSPTGPLLVAGGTVYFAGLDAAHGTELWRSDGTPGGTQLVADVYAGTKSSAPSGIRAVGGQVVFAATDLAHGGELWSSDGVQGAALLADVNPGTASSSPANQAVVGGTLYFAANDGAAGTELWRTDGTPGGTARVADIAVGPAGASPSAITPAAVGGAVFAATDAGGDRELWRTDGTAAGTFRLKDIMPGPLSSSLSSTFAEVGGAVYFVAADATAGRELWKTDGTAGGTVRVKDINPGVADSSPTARSGNASRLYFAATDALHGLQVWSSDGTDAGTAIVKVLVASGVSSNPTNIVPLGGLVLFRVGNALWRTDGTEAGTVDTGLGSQANVFRLDSGQLVLSETIGSTTTLKRTDLTPAGTTPLASFASGIQLLGSIGNTTYFGARSGAGGNALWKTDGTPGGTVLVKDVNTSATPSEGFYAMGAAGNRIVFLADDGVHGRELWVTDGTPGGTTLLKEVAPGAASIYAYATTQFGNTLLFNLIDDATTGTELWVSDGTPAGTHAVGDLNPGLGSFATGGRWRFGALDFFSADDGVHGSEFWVSDGTLGGTRMLADINPGAGSSPMTGGGVGYQGNRLLFGARGANGVAGLWSTDGTPGGTVKVSDSNGAGINPTGQYVAIGGFNYFISSTSLWRTDGTVGGTTIVKTFTTQLQPKTIWGAGNQLVIVTGPTTSDVNNTVWASDGTPAGTVPIPTLPANNTLIGVSNVRVVADSVFFPGRGSLTGTELWRVATDVAPAAPSQFTATVLTGGEIRLDWVDNSDRESGYRLERSGSPTFATIDRAVVLLPDATSFDDQGLAYNTTYYYRLVAYNAGPSSTPVTTSTSTHAIPLRPTGLTAVPATAFAITLTWADAADNEQGYAIERSASPEFATVDVTTNLPPNSTTFTDAGLANDLTYYYRLRAFNADGSTPPALASAHTPHVPAAPTGLAASAVSGGEVDLSWFDASDDDTGFRIERSTVADFSAGVVVMTAPANATSFADRGLLPDTTYYYRVSSVNGVARSVPAAAGAHTPAAPLPPINLVLNAPSGQRVDLSWTDGAGGELGYRIDRSASPTFAVIDRSIDLPANATAYSDATVARLSTYYYRVYAYNAHGNSLDARGSVATPDLAAGDFVATGVSATEIDLHWSDAATTETSYRVERAPVGGAFAPLATLAANATFYADRNLPATSTFVYRVVAVGPGGSAFSAASTATTIAPVLSTPIASFPQVGGKDSKPDMLTVAGDYAYFVVNSTVDGGAGDLWRSDGTPGGTILLRAGQCQQLYAVGDTLYFSGYDAATGWELWASRGTPETTDAVADVRPGTGNGNPVGLAAIGNVLFFGATAEDGSRNLWRSDGTAAGTFQLAANIPVDPAYPRSAAVSGGLLYFAAGASGNNLRVTDGTVAGTRLVKANANSKAYDFTPFNGAVYFFAYDPVNTWAIWRTDGTDGGTVVLKDLYDGNSVPPFSGLTAFGGSLYLGAVDPALALELFKSDGTAAGTGLFLDLVPGGNGSNPGSFTPVGDAMFFVTSPGNMWVTDGTAAGTRQLRPEGFNSGTPMYRVGDKLFYFDDPGFWRSDRTFGGTTQVARIASLTVHPYQFSGPPAAVQGDRIFFTAPVAGDVRELRVAYATAPLAPTGLAVAPPAPAHPATVSLAWADHAVNESGYVIERSVSASFATLDARFYAPAGATSYDDATGAPGTGYFYRVSAVNAGGASAPSNVVAGRPPAVVAANFDYGSASQRVTFRFSADVAASLTAGDFTLVNLTSGQSPSSADLVVTCSPDDGSASVALAGPGASRFADGRYRLTLTAAGVAGATGLTLDGDGDGLPGGDFTFDFFQLAGDANRDGAVGFADLVAVAQHYDTVGGATWATGDFDGDGNVGFADLVVVAQNYDKSLPGAPAPVAGPGIQGAKAAAFATVKAKPAALTAARPVPKKPTVVAKPKPAVPPRIAHVAAPKPTAVAAPSRPTSSKGAKVPSVPASRVFGTRPIKRSNAVADLLA